jgi:hypothetical protein
MWKNVPIDMCLALQTSGNKARNNGMSQSTFNANLIQTIKFVMKEMKFEKYFLNSLFIQPFI